MKTIESTKTTATIQSSSGWAAWVNAMPGQAPKLIVTGRAWVTDSCHTAKLVPDSAPGIPETLWLRCETSAESATPGAVCLEVLTEVPVRWEQPGYSGGKMNAVVTFADGTFITLPISDAV
jgi:hypothetical protein